MANKKKEKRGPIEDRLVLPGNWKDAINKVVKKKRPASGWPTKPKKKPGKQK